MSRRGMAQTVWLLRWRVPAPVPLLAIGTTKGARVSGTESRTRGLEAPAMTMDKLPDQGASPMLTPL